MSGKLFLVPSPLGNLEDMTYRAIRTLKEVDCILAEDTRTSSVLLNYFGIQNTLIPYHTFNEHKTVHSLVRQLSEGKQMALITDAGTPSISDPGFLIVRECIRHNIAVECLPGPTALIPALVISGFPSDAFLFHGFLPHKKGRQTQMKKIAEEERTVIFYESPHRLLKTLEQLQSFVSEQRLVCVVRELSKIHEEVLRGTLQQLHAHFTENAPRGEIVLLMAPQNFSFESNSKE